MVKAILWDNDGVLVDTERYFFQATRDILKTVGMDLPLETFIEFSLIKGYGLCEYMRAGGLDDAECEALRIKRNQHYTELLTGTPTLIDGVRETLSSLHGKYIMGVVTSSQRQHFEVIHKTTGLLDYFDFVITSDDCGNTKPHPEPYLKGVEKTGMPREACVAVEDSARGLTAANRAGLSCLMIPHALTDPGTYRGDYVILNSIREVEDHLVRMAKGCPVKG